MDKEVVAQALVDSTCMEMTKETPTIIISSFLPWSCTGKAKKETETLKGFIARIASLGHLHVHDIHIGGSTRDENNKEHNGQPDPHVDPEPEAEH